MKKIFMVSLVAMMAVTAANADIASTSYVQARTGEMTIGADGKVTDANYAAQNQTLKVVAETDALNAAIGKLDAAIETQKGNFDNKLDAYVKKADANEDMKGGEAGKFVYSVSQVNGDVAAAEGTFLDEIVSGDLPAAQVNAYKVAPQASAVKSYVDGAISAQGTQVTNLSGRVGAVEEYIAGNETKGIESLDERLAAKQDASTEDYQLGNKEGSWTTMSAAQQNALNSGVTTDVVGKANSALQKADIVTGSKNGTIKVDDTDVAVKGLGSAAYTNSSAYATAAQGGKADAALPASSLEQATKMAEGKGDGTYALTMKVVDSKITYQWDLIDY